LHGWAESLITSTHTEAFLLKLDGNASFLDSTVASGSGSYGVSLMVAGSPGSILAAVPVESAGTFGNLSLPAASGTDFLRVTATTSGGGGGSAGVAPKFVTAATSITVTRKHHHKKNTTVYDLY
jgi:hypothetical protein